MDEEEKGRYEREVRRPHLLRGTAGIHVFPTEVTLWGGMAEDVCLVTNVAIC